MKKLMLCIVLLIGMTGLSYAQGYYMGPGMMRGDYYNRGGDDNGGYYMGPGMMSGNWGNNDWHKNAQSSLNLTQEQKSQWDSVVKKSYPSQQAISDSISYYVKQVQRLQHTHSTQVQSDLNRIKKILTPQQYTAFLEKLVAGN